MSVPPSYPGWTEFDGMLGVCEGFMSLTLVSCGVSSGGSFWVLCLDCQSSSGSVGYLQILRGGKENVGGVFSEGLVQSSTHSLTLLVQGICA